MAENINVIVFGATGNVGPFIMERGIKEGFNITAFVRTPSKIPDKLREDIRVVKGDVLKEKDVVDAIKGQDIVLSALGCGIPQSPVTMMSEGCKNIIEGMKTHGVRKIVLICGENLLPGHWRPWLLRHLRADHQRQIDQLNKEKTAIDWIVVTPPFIKPTSQISKQYMVEKNDMTGRMFVTAGEIADFMMKVAKDDPIASDMRHSLVGISNGPAFVSSTTIKLVAGISAAVLTAIAAYYFDLL